MVNWKRFIPATVRQWANRQLEADRASASEVANIIRDWGPCSHDFVEILKSCVVQLPDSGTLKCKTCGVAVTVVWAKGYVAGYDRGHDDGYDAAAQAIWDDT